MTHDQLKSSATDSQSPQHQEDEESQDKHAFPRAAHERAFANAVQRLGGGNAASNEAVHSAASRGVASPSTALPHADKIQASFGQHDISGIRAHVGGDSAAAMGASAYATGNDVVFDKPPDLHTAAHEAAHVVQQAKGVNLYGGVGEAGDSYERNADEVADRVVAGQSAADLLGDTATGSAHAGAVQRKGIEAKHDAEGYLFNAEPHGKQTRIEFGPSVAAQEEEQAAFKPGTAGYVRLDGDHMLTKFTITDVSRSGLGGNKITAHAIVDLPASEFATTKFVVVNPTTYPKQAPRSQHDIKGRVVKVSSPKRDDTHDGKSDDSWRLLVYSAGLEHGVRHGMHGAALDMSGKKIGDVVVATVDGSTCEVDIRTDRETATAVKGVRLNPSAP